MQVPTVESKQCCTPNRFTIQTPKAKSTPNARIEVKKIAGGIIATTKARGGTLHKKLSVPAEDTTEGGTTRTARTAPLAVTHLSRFV